MTFESRWTVTLVAALMLAACGGNPGEDSAGAQSDGEAEEETPPVPVEVGLPTRGDVYALYRGTAPIEAFADADVLAKVAGEVREILVEEGDVVRKGQVLARLDGDRLRLELNESEARLRKLQRDYERNVDLSEKGLISAGDFDRIKYDLEALQASHNLASLELDYTQIRAPIDGVVSRRYIKLGNTLAVNEPVFRVTSLDPLIVDLHVPEREFAQIAAGQPVALEIDALQEAPVQATVTRVSPVVDAATGTFKVTIELYDATRRIKPGMFARVGIVHDRHVDALLVPRSAIVEELGRTSVFVVEDGKARQRYVETGYNSEGRIEILSGLSDDDKVITVGQVGLRPDSAVMVIDAQGDGADVSVAGGNGTEGDGDASTD